MNQCKPLHSGRCQHILPRELAALFAVASGGGPGEAGLGCSFPDCLRVVHLFTTIVAALRVAAAQRWATRSLIRCLSTCIPPPFTRSLTTCASCTCIHHCKLLSYPYLTASNISELSLKVNE